MSDTTPSATQIHFFTGKGGAGKSTLALAHAINLSEESAKAKVLLLSLENPGGVSDLIKKKLSLKPTKLVSGKGQLFAAEMEYPVVSAAFLKIHKPSILAAAAKGAVLSEDDVKKLLDASLQNIDELAAVFSWLELQASAEYTHIVIDGLHMSATVRLIDHSTHLRKIVSLLRGERTQRPSKHAVRPATPVDALATLCDAVSSMLRDAKRFQLHVVATSEPVAEIQTRAFFKWIEERTIPVARIIANVIEESSESREVQNRRGLQAPHVRKYQAMHQKVDLVARRAELPNTFDAVKKLAKEWSSGKEQKSLQFTPAESPPALVRDPSRPPIPAPPLPPTRFIFFVGGGGVGKSSCASAAAVTLTEKEGPVLLLSTDPVHALSEIVTSRLTDTETQVKGTKGLYAREIDVPVWFNNLRKKVKEMVEPMFGPEARGETFAVDKELIRYLVDLFPVGMDEYASLTALTDALVQERFKRIVVDPSNTANAVRVLEIAPVARHYFTALLGVFTKHKNKGAAALIAWLEAQVAHIVRFEKALTNPAESRFVVVTRGEDLALPATERLVEGLQQSKHSVERIIINRVLPKTSCELTEARRHSEIEVARHFEKKITIPVTVTPALGRHPAGLRDLKAFRNSWYAVAAILKGSKAA
jgi:arsenite/tail-anchored protein-transporting ATPase